MLLKPAYLPFNPAARCCWECLHGNGGKPSKRKTIICNVDGDVTFRCVPGICTKFIENERGAKRREHESLDTAL